MRITNIKNWGTAEKQTAGVLLALLLICVAAGAWYHQQHIANKTEQALNRTINSLANNQVDAIGHYIGSHYQDLQRFTRREALSKAILQQEAVTVGSFMSSLEKAFPKAISIRIIPRGTAEIDREHAAPIRFAELDMITRAENHQEIIVEAANIKGAWQFNLLSPIPQDQSQETVATLMVTLNQSAIRATKGRQSRQW